MTFRGIVGCAVATTFGLLRADVALPDCPACFELRPVPGSSLSNPGALPSPLSY